MAEASRALLTLETDPMRGDPLTGSLRRARSLEFSIKDSGVHRAVYLVLEEERVCVNFIVGPPGTIYTQAER